MRLKKLRSRAITTITAGLLSLSIGCAPKPQLLKKQCATVCTSSDVSKTISGLQDNLDSLKTELLESKIRLLQIQEKFGIEEWKKGDRELKLRLLKRCLRRLNAF